MRGLSSGMALLLAVLVAHPSRADPAGPEQEAASLNQQCGALGPESDPVPIALAGRDPLTRSALVMAGAKRLAAHPVMLGQQPRDGLVTALEVGGMNLEGTELVVLSACETGLGAGSRGQGVYGLRRAFFTAGAQTLVTNLWSVSDRATRDLMAGYYERLTKGQGRVAAMHEAMKQARGRHDHPFYWAPFIVLGRGDPLSPASR